MNRRELLIGGGALAAGESLGLAQAAEQRSSGPARVALVLEERGRADVMIEPHLPESRDMSRDALRALTDAGERAALPRLRALFKGAQ